MMLIVSSLPFSPFLILGLYQYLKSLLGIKYSINDFNKSSISLINFSGSWLISVFILFTFAATKLPSYWLPATPAAAILIALVLSSSKKYIKTYSISYLFLSCLMLAIAITLSNPNWWIYSIQDPEMPDFASDLIKSGLHLRSAYLLYFLSFIGFFFSIKPNFIGPILIQIPLILIQFFVMQPIRELADNIRQKPLRDISKEILAFQRENEPIAMICIRKPSVHFYTNQLINY